MPYVIPPIAIDAKEFPHTRAVAAALDLQILSEPQFSDDEEDIKPVGHLYWIGDRGDPSVGIFRLDVTPAFPDPQALEAFVAKHRAEYDALAGLDELPERFFWEQPAQA